MALINEWILKNNLKDTIGDNDLVAYGGGTPVFSGEHIVMNGTYGLKTSDNYPLPKSYTMSIIFESDVANTAGETVLLMGNGDARSNIGGNTHGIVMWVNNEIYIMTGASDGYNKIMGVHNTRQRYHYIVTVNDATRKIYVNGSLISTDVVVSTSHALPLTIGGFNNSPTNFAGLSAIFLKGKINNVRLYDNPISDNGALELYNSYYIKNKTLILHDGEYKKWNEKSENVYDSETYTLTPIMTSDTTPNGETSATEIYNDYRGWKAFDKNSNTGYLSNKATGFLRYDFESSVLVGKYSILPLIYSLSGGANPKSWNLEGSNDGVKWETLDTQSDIIFFNETDKKSFFVKAPKPFKCIRLNVTLSSAGFFGIGELELYEAKNLRDINYSWSTVSFTLPAQEEFLTDGMDSLSPLLDRRVETLEPIKMIDKSEILQVGEVGKVFSKTLDLSKYLDIRNIKVEVR